VGEIAESFAKGSGKTLAYGLPILGHILSAISTDGATSTLTHAQACSLRTIKALILAPTRELALQVGEHLRKMVPPLVSETLGKTEDSGAKPPPLISIAAIVGGMSSQKQKRILDRGLDIVIATPGRLWDIIQEVCR
jgi:ATP-dependent RNA helicase DDX24/MAK5